MQVKIARWGNSLGVRIPGEMARRIGLAEGARVDIEVKNDRLVLSRARPRYALEELLRGMDRKAIGEAFDWGADQGREAIEE
jgi:antitoxin MazE